MTYALVVGAHLAGGFTFGLLTGRLLATLIWRPP